MPCYAVYYVNVIWRPLFDECNPWISWMAFSFYVIVFFFSSFPNQL